MGGCPSRSRRAATSWRRRGPPGAGRGRGDRARRGGRRGGGLGRPGRADQVGGADVLRVRGQVRDGRRGPRRVLLLLRFFPCVPYGGTAVPPPPRPLFLPPPPRAF